MDTSFFVLPSITNPAAITAITIIANIVVVLLIVMMIGMIVRLLFTVWWLPWRRSKYAKKQVYTILAIDIPKLNEQSPKAVEAIFTTLWGSYSGPNMFERYFNGKAQAQFSFEIVSLEGNVQFLIRTPVHFKILVESAVYAQYPDAYITEVYDYVSTLPDKYPNEEYDIWGGEIRLAKDQAYPIRTYPTFEHTLSAEFKDPMASLLEVLSAFGQGEQGWFQIVIFPVKGGDWVDKGIAVYKKLAGQDVSRRSTLAEKATDPLLNFLRWLGDFIVFARSEDKGEQSSDLPAMFKMTKGEQDVIAAIQGKLSKIGFQVKIRYIYGAHKSVFSLPRGVSPVFGAMNQFTSHDLNAPMPDGKTLTTADYFFVQRRSNQKKNSLMRAYKQRLNDFLIEEIGADPFVLNVEELATLWHFPAATVKAPTVQKTESRKAEPPSRLPADSGRDSMFVYDGEAAESDDDLDQDDGPVESPFVPNLATTEFEQQFAKHPQQVVERIEQQTDQQSIEAESNQRDASHPGAPSNLPR